MKTNSNNIKFMQSWGQAAHRSLVQRTRVAIAWVARVRRMGTMEDIVVVEHLALDKRSPFDRDTTVFRWHTNVQSFYWEKTTDD
jgi:hypothetical protein